ncbi:MAG: putative metal-binding motif-containing protein [Alphaproteobacteria bacterium]|nr:putative metal-binding motif-containing protein [Alphaproteobacteria bacterium]
MRALSLLLLAPACVVDTSIINKVSDTSDCEPLVVWADEDGDGYGGGEPEAVCGALEGYVELDGDCDDADAAIHPDAIEVCDGVDQDCDGLIDDEADGVMTFWEDADGDGFGDLEVQACEQPEGTATIPGDCDDSDPGINPAAAELCDGVDQDCNGDIDEDPVDAPLWYQDADGDGYGVEDPNTYACEQPSGYVDNADDCDDTDPTRDLSCLEGTPTGSVLCTGGYPPYTYTDANATEPELNLLSLYEGTPNGSPPQVAVNVDRPSTMVLHLSAYDAVEWTVTAIPNATITEILVSGYHGQTVNAPSGVPVNIRTYDTTRNNYGNWCGYSLPYNGGGCDTDQLIRGVEGYTGLTMSSFTGCYQGNSFTIQ